GHRVLLVDCDFRKPTLHKLFNVPTEPGLYDYICRKKEAKACIRRTDIPDLCLLTAGLASQRIDSMLAAPPVREFPNALKATFDYVILDTSPVLVVSDALSLASSADAVLLVARWNKTKGTSLLAAHRQLVSAGGNVRGAILTKVDMQAYTRYEE